MPDQEIIPPRGPGFQPGHERYGGRKPGQIGRHARLLKELILMAAELEGSDGEGRDGLLGYLRKIAREDLRVFCDAARPCLASAGRDQERHARNCRLQIY
jgi:hypothetical protein